MAIKIKHATQAVGEDAGNGEIRKGQWNEAHQIVMGTLRMIGRLAEDEGAAEELTAAQVKAFLSLTNAALKDAENVYSLPQRGEITTLTVSVGSIAWDLAAGNDFTVTLTANAVLAFPAGAATRIGQKGRILISQDATGGRTLATHANLVPLGSATTPSIPAAANAQAYLAYEVIASGKVIYSLTGVGA